MLIYENIKPEIPGLDTCQIRVYPKTETEKRLSLKLLPDNTYCSLSKPEVYAYSQKPPRR